MGSTGSKFGWYVMKKRYTFLLILLSLSLLFNCFFLISNWQRSVVVSVPDGDSLQLADGRRVRLLGLDAPEKGRCLADDARSMLATLTFGKHVTLRDIARDDYGRLLANVFVDDPRAWFSDGKIVSIALVENGLARSESVSLSEAGDIAKKNKLGIYSETCRKTTPPNGCAIKGNIREGKSVYYLQACKYYDQVIVDEAFGDRWFCNEQEAKEAGFMFASSCNRP